MSRSVDHTRRAFLLTLARSAVFVPPAMATLSVARAAGQGKSTTTTDGSTTGGGGPGGGGGKGNNTTGSTTIGSLSPTAQTVENPTFNLQQSQQNATSPWAPGQAAKAPPWALPPPTQTGR